MSEIGNSVDRAADFLRGGNIVAIPTETVYGLAANALNPLAVARIYEAKERPAFDPLIVHISSASEAPQYVLADAWTPECRLLADAFWPGPLTIVLPKKDCIPEIVTGGLPTVGLRVPAHPLTQALLREIDFPLAAPSANPFGYISPTRAEHVERQLGLKVPYILDGGPCTVGVESTIISVSGKVVQILRPGKISFQDIQNVVPHLDIRQGTSGGVQAPGMLESHYAPGKQVLVVDSLQEMAGLHEPAECIAIWNKNDDPLPAIANSNLFLSQTGDLAEVAANLFAALREADELPGKYILAEWVEEQGIGIAINDRLRRAAAPKSVDPVQS